MKRPSLGWWFPLAALACGCFGTEQKTALVPADPFGNTPPVIAGQRTAYAPAPLESAARVDRIGRQIIAGNPQIGMRPQFRVIGAPQPEVFHHGTVDVLVTDGLVKQCTTDGQLAAVLCHELARMIAEREATADPQVRAPSRRPPMEVRVGNDYTGGGAADQTRLAELGRFEREGGKPNTGAVALPDCPAMAKNYLKKAGFADTDYEAVQPYLKGAAENMTYAKQLKSQPTGGTPRSWTR